MRERGGKVVRGYWLESWGCGETMERRFLSGRRRWLVFREELGGKGKISTIEGVGWGNVGGSSRGGTNAEEDPREMVKPVSRRCTSPKSILEAAVKMFNQPIGLRMVGGGVAVLDVELSTKAVPES